MYRQIGKFSIKARRALVARELFQVFRRTINQCNNNDAVPEHAGDIHVPVYRHLQVSLAS